jgi:signal transduction histidine kinase
MDKKAENPKTILLVDDNADNLELLTATFLGVNFKVEKASSVEHARQKLLGDAHFDMILSDISMPIETGFDLIRWITDNSNVRLKEIPVLLITSEMPQAENRIRGLSMGAVDYVVRPIPAEELILRVNHAIENVRRYKELRLSLRDVENQANVGRLLAASNHEIRNLTGLVLVSANSLANNLAKSSALSNAATLKTIENLTNSAELLADISRNMSSLLSERSTKVCTIELNTLVKQTLALTAMKCKSFKVSYSDDVNPEIWASGNPSRIKQILINFIFNACESLSEAGKEGSGEIKIRLTDGEPGFWQIRVDDNGIGLLGKSKLTTFVPFHTTKSIRGGTGLGLWLCSQLAVSMNGQIYLESDGISKGASAVLSLPKADQGDHANIDISKYL